jgi:hypothetical protein
LAIQALIFFLESPAADFVKQKILDQAVWGRQDDFAASEAKKPKFQRLIYQ